jgi:N utilization substance protein A
LNEAEKIATVTVPNDQLSLAIGRGGQNVRLASSLTGWKINILESATAAPVEIAPEEAAVETVMEEPKHEEKAAE